MTTQTAEFKLELLKANRAHTIACLQGEFQFRSVDLKTLMTDFVAYIDDVDILVTSPKDTKRHIAKLASRFFYECEETERYAANSEALGASIDAHHEAMKLHARQVCNG